MADPKSDREAEKDLLPLLKRDEHLLWAARRNKPSRAFRYGTYVWFAVSITATAFMVAQGGIFGLVLPGLLLFPTLYLVGLGNWFVTYCITETRLYILCRLPPRSRESLNLVDWDTNWMRFDVGKNRIRLSYFGPIMRPGWWSKSQYRRYHGPIENVPDVEAVRDLLLKKIGASQRPSEETPPARKKSRKPVISGTMTG